ncbi:long-chain-fatty-acid-CoA ligase [Armillaria gallica]|uniref:Long-chain-fatty-acid-CoA ligase n=1 Tax=Armillaria gallica TaxID=47427 RepID=A0A2H3EFL0_ARMGA|nr:long-chain-fatty-acid-CoA ligase [Armillaria gallica]
MADTETWTPCCSIEEADKKLTRIGSLLEIETRVIGGRVLKVWKNLWPSMRLFFLHSTKQHADKTYVVYEKERYTFREISEKAVTCAAIFRDVYGVRKGDRVSICSRNCPTYFVVFWACHLLGAVTALMDPSQPVELLRYCFTLTRCTLIVLDPERADMIETIAAELRLASETSGYIVLEEHEGKGHWQGMDVWKTVFSGYNGDPGDMLGDDPQILPEDDATITFTSGTTGLPKGVLSSQRAFLTPIFNVISLAGRDCLRRGEPFPPVPIEGPQEGTLIPRALSNATAFNTAMFGTSQGLKLVLTRTWNVHEVVELYKTENITRLSSTSSIVRELVDSPLSEISMRTIAYGGTSMATAHFYRLKQAFPLTTFIQVYGLTENGGNAVGIAGSDFAARPDSCGFVTPVNEILIMKDGVKVPPGVEGEIWVRGPNVMKGYYGNSAATDKVLTNDGWLMTGDLGRMDEYGYVYLHDRIEDIIVCGGNNVDSIFVENALYTEPGVFEVAVVGVPDEYLGEVPVALVSLKPRYGELIDEEGLLATAEKQLPKYAVPVMIILYDSGFDHTSSGKIIKAPLRAIAQKEWARRSKQE